MEPAVVSLLVTLCLVYGIHTGDGNPLSIDDFGAMPNNNSYGAAIINGQALVALMNAVNQDTSGVRTGYIPFNSSYYMIPDVTPLQGLVDVTLQLDGEVLAWTDEVEKWPIVDGNAVNLFQFVNCSNVRVLGYGTVEGQGYWWWWYVIAGGYDNRPNLFYMYMCQNVTFTDWTLRNAPQYHVLLEDVVNVYIYNLTIHVNVEDQAALLESFGLMSSGNDGIPKGIPTFPLNTDGIDVAGRNVTVQHCRVTNFDDAVCLKPLTKANILSTCTEDVLFQDIDITFGVGASVGSVGPDPNVACIRNSTFRDIRFTNPIKAIYVKPNPGDVGSGIIDRITYENIVAKNALWWSIWVSTQQEHQPSNGSRTPCSFFYPIFNSSCPTQPLVPVTNLVLRNVTMTGALLSPGVLRCNDSGPCTGWLFEDVLIESASNYPAGNAFICAGITNSTGFNVSPSISECFNSLNTETPRATTASGSIQQGVDPGK